MKFIIIRYAGGYNADMGDSPALINMTDPGYNVSNSTDSGRCFRFSWLILQKADGEKKL